MSDLGPEPKKPTKQDTCRWCLTLTYEQCGNPHWKLIGDEWFREWTRWKNLQYKEKQKLKPKKIKFPKLILADTELDPVRKYLSEIGRRGGLRSQFRRSKSQRAASTANIQGYNADRKLGQSLE